MGLLRRCAVVLGVTVFAVGCSSAKPTDAGEAAPPPSIGMDDAVLEPPAPEPQTAGPTTTERDHPPLRWPTQLRGECNDTGDCTMPWLDEWRRYRTGAVEEIIESDWGVDDDLILRGPGGRTLDLNECRPSWDPSSGIGDDEIVVSIVGALTGVRGWVSPLQGFTVAIDEANASGGIAGRSVRLEIHDWGAHVGAHSYVAEGIEDTLWVATYGWPETRATRAALGRDCLPLPFAFSHRLDHQPFDPWVSGSLMTSDVEMAMWAELLNQPRGELADLGLDFGESGLPGDESSEALRVAALVMDNDFGRRLLTDFEDAMETRGAPMQIEYVVHDPAAPDLEVEMARLADSEPDVVLLMTAGEACAQATAAADQPDMVGAVRLMVSFCRDTTNVALAGPAAAGWMSVSPGSEVELVLSDEPGTFDAHVRQLFEAAALDAEEPAHAAGYRWGWLHLELMRVAAELPGGLSKPNLLLALWSLDVAPPLSPVGVPIVLDGPHDRWPIESGTLVRWDADAGHWEPVRSIDVTMSDAEARE